MKITGPVIAIPVESVVGAGHRDHPDFEAIGKSLCILGCRGPSCVLASWPLMNLCKFGPGAVPNPACFSYFFKDRNTKSAQFTREN